MVTYRPVTDDRVILVSERPADGYASAVGVMPAPTRQAVGCVVALLRPDWDVAGVRSDIDPPGVASGTVVPVLAHRAV